jgi:hypothetical protein
MREAVGKTYPEFEVQGITDYKLFKGITFNNTEPNNNKNDNSVNNPSKVDDNQYVIDMKVAELNRTDDALSKSTINVIDGNTVLVVNAKISSVNALGNTVFHYQASVCLSLTKEALAATKLSSQLTRVLATPLTAKMVNEAAELYQNGTLFHGESLQGISHLVECNEQGLVLACQVPEIATKKQGDFTMSTDNIFANDLVYQAMLVWTQKKLALGSLPSTTQSWQTFAHVQRGQIFYVSLVVVKAPVKNAKLKNATVIANVSLIDQQGQHLAVIKGVEVTASENLQGLFLASSTVRSQQLKPHTLLAAD